MKRTLLYSVLAVATLSFSSCSRQALSLESTQQLNAQQAYSHQKAKTEVIAQKSDAAASENNAVVAPVEKQIASANTLAPAVKHRHGISALKNKVAGTVAGLTAMRAVKSAVKQQLKNNTQLLASNTKSVKAPKFAGYLGTAIALVIVALILFILAVGIPIFYLIASILLIVALIFFLLWILDMA